MYRGTSLKRNSNSPQGHHGALGTVLLQGPRGLSVFLWARYPCISPLRSPKEGRVLVELMESCTGVPRK